MGIFSLSKSTASVGLDLSEWALLVFGALLVGGLVIEFRAQHGSRWMKIGEVLVIIGVFGELMGDGGIFLFSRYLQKISDKEIAVLTHESDTAKEQTARLELDAMKLQEQLIAQGSRTALLYGKNRGAFVKKLEPFRGQKIEVRYCDEAFNMYFVDHEAMGVAMLLQTIMGSDAHWDANPLVEDHCGGMAVGISVNPKASKSTREAADALLGALQGLPFVILGGKVFVEDSPRTPQKPTFSCGTTNKCANTPVVFPPLGNNTIVLTVFSHP